MADLDLSKPLVVQGTETAGYVAGAEVPAPVAALSRHQLGTREDLESELDQMLGVVKEFYAQEPDQIMVTCSALSARLTEMSIHLHRVEGRYRDYKQVRTMQVQPLLAELDRQFKLASRSVELRRQDLELMK